MVDYVETSEFLILMTAGSTIYIVDRDFGIHHKFEVESAARVVSLSLINDNKQLVVGATGTTASMIVFDFEKLVAKEEAMLLE